MSETPKFNTPEFLQRWNEFADKMTTEKLATMSPEEVAAIMDEYAEFVRQAEIPRGRDGWEMEAFALSLMARQGTYLQDFEAFYRKRDELDRELLGGSGAGTPAE